jgi:hypothetical protein
MIYERELPTVQHQHQQPIVYQAQPVMTQVQPDDNIHIHLNNSGGGTTGGSSLLMKAVLFTSLVGNAYFYFVADDSCSAGVRGLWQDISTSTLPTRQAPQPVKVTGSENPYEY